MIKTSINNAIGESIIALLNETEVKFLKKQGYAILQIEKGHGDKYIVEYFVPITIEKNEEEIKLKAEVESASLNLNGLFDASSFCALPPINLFPCCPITQSFEKDK